MFTYLSSFFEVIFSLLSVDIIVYPVVSLLVLAVLLVTIYMIKGRG